MLLMMLLTHSLSILFTYTFLNKRKKAPRKAKEDPALSSTTESMKSTLGSKSKRTAKSDKGVPNKRLKSSAKSDEETQPGNKKVAAKSHPRRLFQKRDW
jgi:hypothetical protein